jgi:hypothetical protein
VRGVVKAPDARLGFSADASVIDWTGAILAEVPLKMNGRFLLAIDLSDDEFEQLMLARLNMRPAATLAAIGRALTADADNHEESVSLDVLQGLAIDRSRFGQNVLGIRAPGLSRPM